MTKRQWLFVLLVTAVISFSLGGQGIAGDDDKDRTCPLPIKVDVYTECQGAPCSPSTTDGGAPYSSRFGTFRSSDISFATTTGLNWHPFNQGAFGADLSGCIEVKRTGMYNFTLTSDDGSMLWIDGNLVVDNGDPHPPNTMSGSTSLTAGVHSFEVQFFECCGGPSGVDLTLPQGVEYVCCKGCEDKH